MNEFDVPSPDGPSDAQLDAMTFPEALRVPSPRRFALVELPDDEALADEPPVVYSWGMNWPERAVLMHPNGRPRGVFQSAESACAMYSLVADVVLWWVDPEPGATT